MSKFSVYPPANITPEEARAQIRAMVYASDAQQGGVQSVEVPATDVPEWEQDCPCTFSVYVMHLAKSGTWELAFERLYAHNGYQSQRWSQEEHNQQGEP